MIKKNNLNLTDFNLYRDPVIIKLNSIKDHIHLLFNLNLIDIENLGFFNEQIDDLINEFNLTCIDIKKKLDDTLIDE